MKPCPFRPPAFALMLLCALAPVAALGQTATPAAGEGIWGLLRSNGLTPTARLANEFRALNADILGSSDELKVGVHYRLPGSTSGSEAEPVPAAAQGRKYPIFGAQYEMVQIRSNRLEGHVYYIVAGHGGPDPGSHARLNGKYVAEDEIAYDTSLRVARRLIEEGGLVYVIVRDPDDGIRDLEYLPPDNHEYFYGGEKMSQYYVRRARQRRDVINDLYDKHRKTAKSQQVIAVHVDAYDGRNQPQIDVYFSYSSDSGRELGTFLQAQMRQQYATHQPDRGYKGRLVKRSDLFILNDTKPTAVLVELGNIRHRGDQIRLTKPANRQALAEWIAEGLVMKAVSGQRLASR